jgi:hypothetical protein
MNNLKKFKISFLNYSFFFGILISISFNVDCSQIEHTDFYIDNSCTRLGIYQPEKGPCLKDDMQNCHALFKRVNRDSSWILAGPITKGKRPL